MVIPDVAYIKIQNSLQLLPQWVLHHIQHHGLGKRKGGGARQVREGWGRKWRCDDEHALSTAIGYIATESFVHVHVNSVLETRQCKVTTPKDSSSILEKK